MRLLWTVIPIVLNACNMQNPGRRVKCEKVFGIARTPTDTVLVISARPYCVNYLP